MTWWITRQGVDLTTWPRCTPDDLVDDQTRYRLDYLNEVYTWTGQGIHLDEVDDLVDDHMMYRPDYLDEVYTWTERGVHLDWTSCTLG